jgi:hypothetical protein
VLLAGTFTENMATSIAVKQVDTRVACTCADYKLPNHGYADKGALRTAQQRRIENLNPVFPRRRVGQLLGGSRSYQLPK